MLPLVLGQGNFESVFSLAKLGGGLWDHRLSFATTIQIRLSINLLDKHPLYRRKRMTKAEMTP